MAKRRNLRREKRLARRIGTKTSKKLVGLFFVVILALVALTGRITYINATRGERYERLVLSQAQQQYDSRTIPFQRGDIIDRNGTILATSEKVYNVILDCRVVNAEVKQTDGTTTMPYVEPTVTALVKVLGMNETDIRKRLTDEATRDSQYQILRKNMSIADKKSFEEFLDVDSEANAGISKEEKTLRSRVKGVWFEEVYNRVYPLGSQACDLIGFTYDGTTADWGVEGYYSSVLNGVNGRQYGYFNTDADVEQTIIPAVDGKTVALTVDSNIQQIIRDALESFEDRYATNEAKNNGAKNVGVVVMDPQNGEILGMDSTGWYDLNDPRDLTPFYTKEELKEMSDEEQLDALNAIWRNYCISDAFEPGSTFKPVTASAALSSGAVTTEDIFYCDGAEQVAEWFIRCVVYPYSHGEETIADALRNSCNDAFMQIGAKIGANDFLRYQRSFNFGARTGIDLPGENTGIIFNEETMGTTQLATSSFGQGFTCTMVQEAAAFSAVINGGNYYKPHVVREIQDASGAVVSRVEPVVESQVISQEVSDVVREALGAVVEQGGTGTNGKVPGYTMGGKTGTAEKMPRGNDNFLLSFVGFAPLDDPQVLVYVVVDEPNVAVQDSSIYASNVAREIMEKLFPYMNLFPDEEGYVASDEEPVYEEPPSTKPLTDEDDEGADADEDAADGGATGSGGEGETAGDAEAAGETGTDEAAEETDTAWEGTVPRTEDVTVSTEDGTLAEPPVQEDIDPSVYVGGNNILSDGIANRDQELTGG